ncbi:gram domain protein [Moniliophthora roreri MCA 2997]|uniref:Gram domain protein n=1 Tax=Moniliophthora roreri (strain MCA 2997) TaxID=1381753 RepID=V2XYC6_MONRO|nr:gram domain protein [Moniliophthora roreri MCA 2997]
MSLPPRVLSHAKSTPTLVLHPPIPNKAQTQRKNSASSQLPSPPRMNRSPSTSNMSSTSHGQDNKKKEKKPRRSSSSGRQANQNHVDGLPHDSYAQDIDYYSGLDSSDSDSDDEEFGSSEDDEILGTGGPSRSHASRSRELSVDSLGLSRTGGAMGELPVTGFAVASSRRNAEFHELFSGIPEGDYLIEDYGCALQREILIQGRLYISENHICFHANILGWITDLSIPIYEITALEKKMTAFVIPNAIQITTRRAKYTFASFLARDTTFDVIWNIWRVSGGASGSVEGAGAGSSGAVVEAVSVPVSVFFSLPTRGADQRTLGVVQRKQTRCACSSEGKHYPEVALDAVVPGTPDRIHNLMFASGFIKEFMSGPQGLLDIQMSDWTPLSSASSPGLLARNMSYIKPLNASVGPKQTKCEIRDEVEVNDPENYISTITTTRTPDVPSGGVFSVKTRTCLMWESAVETRVVVSTVVEWTGRSFIRGIIERSCIEGQRTYHLELERAMRVYIKEHQSEFIPEGIELPPPTSSPEVVSQPLSPTSSTQIPQIPLTPAARERERNQRAFQWAWDTFAGAANVGKNSAKGAIELIRDAWDQSETTTVLYFVIVGLVLSNLWTWWSSGSGSGGGEAGLGKRELRELRELRKELRERESLGLGLGLDRDREKWVQGIVGAVWEEMNHGSASRADGAVKVAVGEDGKVDLGSVKDAVGALKQQLDDVESRVKAIRESLDGLSIQELD